MLLGQLLSENQILPAMRATDRWSALSELLGALVAAGRVRPEDEANLLAELRKREESMSTGIGFGIAIPHTSSDRVTEVVAAFGRSREGIEFESLDNAPARFIVLFIVPKDEFQTHLQTLAAIAKFLNDRSIREQLAVADGVGEILGILNNRAPGVHA